MRRSSSWLLSGGFAVISLLALPACVEGTTLSTTASAPSEAAGTPAPAAPPAIPATPAVPATPATPAAPATPATPANPPVGAMPANPPVLPSTPAAPSVGAPVAGNAPGVLLITLDGTWESPSCGSRTYPRRLTFAEAASFLAEDLISPCPKGTTCIWSGIINRQGTYRIEKETISLTVAKTSSGPAKSQFPTSLTLDANHAPVEGGSDGKACVYAKRVERGGKKP